MSVTFILVIIALGIGIWAIVKERSLASVAVVLLAIALLVGKA